MRIALKFGLAWPEIRDLYDVWVGECRIGRVWYALDRSPGERPWEWLIALPMILPDTTKGSAVSLDEALSALASAWGMVVVRARPDRLQRALELARAVDLKQQASEPDSLPKFMTELLVELSGQDLNDDARVQPEILWASTPRPKEPAATQAPTALKTRHAPAQATSLDGAGVHLTSSELAAPASAAPAAPQRARTLQIPKVVTHTVVAGPATARRVLPVNLDTAVAAPTTATVVVRPTKMKAKAKPQPSARKVLQQRIVAVVQRSSGEIWGDIEKVLGNTPTSAPPPR